MLSFQKSILPVAILVAIIFCEVANSSAIDFNFGNKSNKTPGTSTNVSIDECGGVLSGEQGMITYKLDEHYSADELCIWTIRTSFRSHIRFVMMKSGIETYVDFVDIHTFKQNGLTDNKLFQEPVREPAKVILNGTVAIVIFRSDFARPPRIGTGFQLTFEAVGEIVSDVSYYNDYNTESVSDSNNTFQYPESGVYNNLELSTFVFTKPNYVSGLDQMVHMNVTHADLEYDEQEGKCVDAIHIFRMPTWSYTFPVTPEFTRFTPAGGHCVGSLSIRYCEAVVIVLSTDSKERRGGFTVDYRLGDISIIYP